MKTRLLALALTVALLLTAVGGVLPASALWVDRPDGLMGDVDGDGKITTTDARLALQYSAKKVELDERPAALAAVNGQETVSTTDARLILQFAAKKITSFPCGKEALTVRGYSDPELYPNENPETFADYTAGNPIITNLFTADPSAHVWKDGRLYLYPSRDIFPARGCDLMNKYHVFSTDNMVDWKDEGQIMESDDVPWSNCDGFMWAPDCCYIEKTDTYYFVYPHPISNDNGDWNASWAMGIASSKSPTGPFTQLGFIKLDESLVDDALKAKLASNDRLGFFDVKPYSSRKGRDGNGLNISGYAIGGYSIIDPCLFVDEDDTVYLYYGGGSHAFVTVMGEDMVTATTVPKEISGLTDFHEGLWVFKYPENGFYYALYADNNSGHNRLRYAVGRTPTGRFNAGGVVLDVTDCDTSHGSIAMYKGNWYLFYHNCSVSGQGNLRTTCVDQLFFTETGQIQLVKQTKTSVPAVGPAVPREGGDVLPPVSAFTVSTAYDLTHATVGGGASIVNKGTVVQNLHNAGSWCDFSGIDGGKGGKALVTLNFAAQSNAFSKVETSGGDPEGYFLRMESTGSYGLYTGYTSCIVDLKPGKENTIRFNGGAGYNIKSITVSLLPENAD